MGQGVEGLAEAEFDFTGEAGTGDVCLGDFGVSRVGLKRYKLAAAGQAAGEPDGGIPTEAAHLKDGARADGLGEDHQPFALIGGDGDGGKSGFGAGGECGFEHGVGGDQRFGDVAVDGGPLFLRHGLRIRRVGGVCSDKGEGVEDLVLRAAGQSEALIEAEFASFEGCVEGGVVFCFRAQAQAQAEAIAGAGEGDVRGVGTVFAGKSEACMAETTSSARAATAGDGAMLA